MMKATQKAKSQNGRPARAISQRNTSGAIGITLHLKAAPGASGGVYAGWTALYMVDGIQRRNTWSVGQWGYEEAWKKALAHRAKMTGTARKKTPPPDRKVISKHLKDRLGPDWRSQVRPAFNLWWK